MKAKRIDINWHSGLSVYASEKFLKAVGDEFGWLGGTDSSGTLRCILPYTIVRKGMIRMVRFRVEAVSLGGELEAREEELFLNDAMAYFRSIGADVVIPASVNTIFRSYPEGAVVAPYGSYIIDLERSEDVLWNNVHSKHRNVIRNAKNKGVQIRSGTQYLDVAYQLVRDTFKRSSLPFMSHEAFHRMVAGLGENVKVFVAESGGINQGCAVIPYSGYSAYYAYGGSSEHPISGATNLLQWEAMRSFRDLGVKRYDFCGVRINPEKGSKAAGLMMYKERFGGQLVQGYMWKYALSPLKSALYSLAVRLLRGGDIVDKERHKLPNAQRPLVQDCGKAATSI
jgi:hypothetical protein